MQRTLSTDSRTHEDVLSVLNDNGPSAAYIDLEASGLGDKSWPIEVGWAVGTDMPVSETLCPHPDWPMSAWDEQAEALHGLSVADLQKSGGDPVQVCKTLNDALAGKIVYSDAPDWDGYWLYRLHTAARMRQTFKLHHFAELMPVVDLAGRLELITRTNALAPHTHRAADDVRHMQILHAHAILYQVQRGDDPREQ